MKVELKITLAVLIFILISTGIAYAETDDPNWASIRMEVKSIIMLYEYAQEEPTLDSITLLKENCVSVLGNDTLTKSEKDYVSVVHSACVLVMEEETNPEWLCAKLKSVEKNFDKTVEKEATSVYQRDLLGTAVLGALFITALAAVVFLFGWGW